MAKNIRRRNATPNVYAPKKQLDINLYQDISDHASELLWGQGHNATLVSEKGNEHLQDILKHNSSQELFPYLEKLLSLYGNMYVTIDMVDGKPTWTIADPQLNSISNASPSYPQANNTFYGMGRALATDEVAVIWKRITFGAVNFPIKEIWDKEKVTRIFFGENNKQITMAAVNKKIPKEEQLDEVWYHNMGFVPVIWFKNRPSYNALALSDGYKGAALQSLVDKTLSELWHETETNRTRIIGNLDETTYNQIMKNGDLAEINRNDFLINVKMKNSTGDGDNQLIPILADPKFDAYWSSIGAAKDEFYKLAGYSPLGDGNTEKTATENLLMKTGDYQTTKLKRNQRYSEIYKLLKYTLAIDVKWGFGNVYGDFENDLTFEIMENKVMDSLQEIGNMIQMVDNDFMSRVEAIKELRGVTKEEAKAIFEDILKEKEEYAKNYAATEDIMNKAIEGAQDDDTQQE